MELFHEIKNRYFLMIIDILNKAQKGISKEELISLIDEGEFEQKVIGKDYKSFLGLLLNEYDDDENYNLLKEIDNFFYPIVENNKEIFPIRFSIIEKAWISSMLEMNELEFVLDKSVIQKLKSNLLDIDSPIKSEYIEFTNTKKLPEIDDFENYKSNFRILLEAISNDKSILYNNTDRTGFTHCDKRSLPIAIEYSVKDGRFRLSMYSLDENRPIMANIFSLSNIRIQNEKPELSRREAKKKMIKLKYCIDPIILEVYDEKNAMERCFMTFSGMERSSKQLGENVYEIKLKYYLFEEDSIIRNIISLGPYIKVKSPERIKLQIIKKVQKALELM